MKKRIFLVLLSMLMLVPTGAFAKKSSSENRAKVMVQGGLLVGLNLPTLSLYSKGQYSELIFDLNDEKAYFKNPLYPWNSNMYVQFGGKIGANFGLFGVTKRNRAAGFVINAGYDFKGGVHSYSSVRVAEAYDEYIGEKLKVAKFSHSIFADINFASKSKMNGSANFAFEIGVRFLPTFEYVMPFNDKWKPMGKDYDTLNWHFFVGPNMFFGADIRTGNNFMMTPGFRFSATFAADSTQSYADRRDYKTVAVKADLNFAFELKINGYVKK